MKTERQQQIIMSALKLINTKGIQGFTIKNLAGEIGITEAAIYRHFKNKNKILEDILDVFSQHSSAVFTESINTDVSAADKIQIILINHFRVFTKMPSVASVIFSEEIFRNDEALSQKISSIINRNNEILIRIVSKGQKINEIRNDISAENIVIMIMGTLRVTIKKWKSSDYSFDLNIKGEEIYSMIQTLIKKL